MKNYIFLFCVLLFASCNNEEQKKSADVVKSDSSVVETTSSFPFLEKNFKQLTLPLNMDTLFVQTVDTNHRITYQQIRQLGINFLKGQLGDGLVYDINEHAQIDSLKQSGGYKAYLEKLDIGMTKTCIAYKVGVVNLSDGNKIFIWGITNASYEACPFFSGTLLVGTFVNKNNEATLFNMAELSAGGDPPAMMDTETMGQLNFLGSRFIKQTVSLT
ncbi:MAG: hypothetical protein H0W73_02955 [Bacteroidetes bacterium]|nr:hypothetical protein [Bacteroidota bacterium]